jgi:calcium-dependent protein kinase
MIDFGTAKMFKKGTKFNEKIGTINYMAPEIFKKCYDEKCDIWSIGVIAYVIMVGKFHIEVKIDDSEDR